MMGSKGIFLMIWNKREYGYAAANFAMSIKYYCPSLPIHLLTDRSAIDGVINVGFFDSVEYMDETPRDPALAKMQVYDKLPFDNTLFLDVDALCIGNLEQVLDQFISDGKPYRCAVHDWYDASSPENFPMMVWATKSTIWEHYKLNGERLPATQSSIQFIQKGEFCKALFDKMQANYANKIPTEKLKNKWGGGQPDELYLNITLAQLHYDPSFTGVIYFADRVDKSFTQVKVDHQILSMFGTANNIKKPFLDAYDNSLKAIGQHMGGKPTLWKYIAGGKHANIRVSHNDGMKRGAFVKRFFKEEKLEYTPIKGTVNLFTSYYKADNEDRQKEINTCMEKNIADRNITKIYNLGLSYTHEKVVNLNYSRPTYQDFITEANKAGGTYSIIANSDIYFDDTLSWIGKVDMSTSMIALSRYNVDPIGRVKLFAYAHSQDVWIFKGQINVKGGDYMLGVPGCDNRFAYDCMMSGYKVQNPAKDIKTYHLHNSNVRNYSEDDRLHGNYKPVYISSINEVRGKRMLLVQPGKVGDILICLPIAKWYADKGYAVEWECPVQYHSLFNYVDYCTPVIKRSGVYDYECDLSFGINTNSKTHANWIKRRSTLNSFVTLKYELAGVPIDKLRELKYTRNEAREKELYDLVVKTNDNYALVHRSSDYGNGIDVHHNNVVLFQSYGDYSIFDWRLLIERASEIHCIDSSLANFVDAVQTEAKLFYYITDRVPLQADRTLLVKQWETINQLQHADI